MKNFTHQIKSNLYYIFWGICTATVIGGQIYVGLGYREMAKASKSTAISVSCVTPYVTPRPLNRTGEFE
jgi:hypothetical protein